MNMLIWRRDPDSIFPEGAFYIQIRIKEGQALAWCISGGSITSEKFKEIEEQVKKEQEK